MAAQVSLQTEKYVKSIDWWGILEFVAGFIVGFAGSRLLFKLVF